MAPEDGLILVDGCIELKDEVDALIVISVPIIIPVGYDEAIQNPGAAPVLKDGIPL